MIVDVHGHISPPSALARFPMPPSLGDVEGMIARKLAHGVELTVVGSPVGAGAMVPLLGVDNYSQSDDDLQRLHEWFVQMVQRHPRHLRAYVYVNPHGGERHLARAEETASDDAFVGFIVNSSVRGDYLDDPRAADFFAMAAQSGLPVMVHAPAQPAAGTGLTDLGLVEQLGRFCDVTVGVASIVMAGWLARYPSLRLIAAGAGGALALLPERLDAAHAARHWGGAPRRQPAGGELVAPPSSSFGQVYVDTATPSALALRINAAAFGAARVLFGTDSPPLGDDAVSGPLAALRSLELDEPALRGVLVQNAADLFGPRLAIPAAA